MSTEVVPTQTYEVPITEDQTALIKNTICKDATDAEMKLFFYDCQRRGVHPLDKLIHFTKRSGKYTPVTSIDFFRQRAHTSGAYAGEDEPVFVEKDGLPESCTYRVYRIVQGVRCQWTATARWKEYYPGDAQGFMWKKMPHLMLAKCAEALALRKAFPAELQGLYVNEEMDQADSRPPVLQHKQTAQAKIAELRQEHTDYKGMPPSIAHEDTTDAADDTAYGQDAPPADDAPAFIWRVGKHKSESIVTIPDDYLVWYLREGKFQDHLQAAEQELDRRRGQGALPEQEA